MTSSSINQKEYLKRYLSGRKDGIKKKKKKDKQRQTETRVKIIDDDDDVVTHIQTAEEADELLGGGEDAPQIVGVIDDRPLSLRIDDYRKSDLWKPIGDEHQNEESIKKESTAQQLSFSLSKNKGEMLKNGVSKSNIETSSRNQNDLRPQQNVMVNSLKDLSPPRNRRGHSSPTNRMDKLRDLSPPRKRTIDNLRDLSPPRQRYPPLNLGKREITSLIFSKENMDHSPPHVKKSKNDLSPTRIKSITREMSEDMSPPRRKKYECNDEKEKNIISPHSKKPQDSSPPRKRVFHESIDEPGVRKNKYVIPQKRIISDKMENTLDGKKAGLQNAQELIKENEAFKVRENKMFESLNEEVSGKNATVVMRDRKTGKIRDLNKEAEEKKKKEEKEAKNKEKYLKWGKGLKQVEEQNEKNQQDLYEMSKPLARYADDKDLEIFLKEQEREGDPMLAYIRKKKKKTDIETGKPEKPMYQGEFMPNRFGIPPGHRWDGVDRSNGYEKRWFEVQNAQRAQQEDIYKWSTEDM